MSLPGETEAGLCGDATMLRDSLVVVSTPENPRPKDGILTNGERPLSISG
jgi:hypothetical protein